MIGRQLSHYRILEAIGTGGMGTVYRAEDTLLTPLLQDPRFKEAMSFVASPA